MANLRNQIVMFFRNNQRFAIAEAVLVVLTVVLFQYEIGYWVFSAFLALVSGLFFLGINYDYWTGKKFDISNEFAEEFDKLTAETRKAIESIKELENDLEILKQDLNKN